MENISEKYKFLVETLTLFPALFSKRLTPSIFIKIDERASLYEYTFNVLKAEFYADVKRLHFAMLNIDKDPKCKTKI